MDATTIIVNWQHITLTIIGAMMYNLMKLDDLKKEGWKFNFKIWVEKNWIPVIMSTLSIITMFMLKEELKDVAGFDMSNRLGCFLAGFTAHTFISMVRSTASKKTGVTDSDNANQKP